MVFNYFKSNYSIFMDSLVLLYVFWEFVLDLLIILIYWDRELMDRGVICMKI